MAPPETRFVDIRGLPMAVHEWGPPSQPILLMLHGFLDHGLAFQPMAERLCDTWRVVAPDLRGHGRSGWVGAGGNYHFPDYYHDLRVLLDHLAAPVTLVGHSMGGMIACGVAALQPQRVRALVLLDGMGPHGGEPAEAAPRLQRWVEALSVPGFGGDVETRRNARRPLPSVAVAADRLQAANPRLGRQRALHLAETGTEPVPGGVAWRHDPLHRVPSSRPFRTDEARSLWAAIQAPVLSIYAGASEWRLPDLAERHACVRDLTAATLPDASHNLHHEQPEVLADAIRAWLADRHAGSLPGLLPGMP